MTGRAKQIEVSNLSGRVWREGHTFDLQIYRLTGHDLGWVLEVKADGSKPVIWDHAFASEGAAVSEFNRAVKEEGLSAFQVERPRFRGFGTPPRDGKEELS
ncbi:MAG: hypothetical protein CL534_13215 [Ahrensia sp.]|nr:hypothetical protein [Ahrensia sp.]